VLLLWKSFVFAADVSILLAGVFFGSSGLSARIGDGAFTACVSLGPLSNDFWLTAAMKGLAIATAGAALLSLLPSTNSSGDLMAKGLLPSAGITEENDWEGKIGTTGVTGTGAALATFMDGPWVVDALYDATKGGKSWADESPGEIGSDLLAWVVNAVSFAGIAAVVGEMQGMALSALWVVAFSGSPIRRKMVSWNSDLQISNWENSATVQT